MKRKAVPVFRNAVTALAPLRARWQALSPRERYLSTLAASAVGLLLVWAVALAPALRSLQKASTQRIVLDGQLQRMLALQAEAQLLAAQPRIGREVALKALQESVTGLGSGAQLQVSGERAVITLRGVPAAAVATWLGQARANARAIPVEARLVRSPVRSTPPAGLPGAAGAIPAVPANPGNFGAPGYGAALGATGIGANTAVAPNAGSGALAGVGRSASADPAPAPGTDIRWDGTLVVALPAA